MCRVLRVHRSGFYVWLKQPVSARTKENQRLVGQIRKLFIASGGTYGSRWIHRDLKELGEICSVHRVARLMRPELFTGGDRIQAALDPRWSTSPGGSEPVESGFRRGYTKSSVGRRHKCAAVTRKEVRDELTEAREAAREMEEMALRGLPAGAGLKPP